MQVILLQDVRKLGKKGETISVSDGYGANYLIPKGLAVSSTAASQKELAKQNALEQQRQVQLKKEAEELSKRLEHINVEFTAKVGSDGRMFGSISPKEIEEGLFKQWGIKIDKRKFIDKYPANAIGYTRLQIELYHGSEGTVVGTVNVHISEEK
ncbi:MAG: 50S ribosomal protein L9 [Firmicutes bacterium]|uniref:Large ribosomal subunit protein bL9 n=1 Tax=Candidatus Alloenteromonas pullistercoris TaxID=2840785 RepID=A0A9D9DFN2_9FIRM|nr:50S ribosomal protein L9 [Candidatus Enteromonas pullistercoris]